MNDKDRKMLRAHLGGFVLDVQQALSARYKPEDCVPEIAAALASLATHIARYNLQITREDYNTMMDLAWKENERDAESH